VHDPDETVSLTIFYSLYAGPDVGPVQTVERAVDRPTGHPLIRAASGRKQNMPVCTLVQAREISLPNLMISADKAGYHPFGRFNLGKIRGHPKPPRPELVP